MQTCPLGRHMQGFSLARVSPMSSETPEAGPEESRAEPLRDWKQATRHLFMIRPSHFGPNAETACSNQFQQAPLHTAAELSMRALREFDGVVAALDRVGAQVLVAADLPDRVTPDAVFPNNWVSTHNDGTAVLYPMAAGNRRAERRPDLLRWLAAEGG
ncbi:MAG: hypothetical protein FJ170_04525, partial [Gammaproteobacteria bacterium]|nr:hypothetical protein [Gammaproteobacteria bacterium]